MSTKVEHLEHNMAKLTIEVSPEEFERSVQRAYEKQRKNIAIPGFRKGKVPRKMIEKMYGKEIFFEDAANDCIPTAYEEALKEHEELKITSRPQIDVTQIESGKPFIFTAEVALKPEVELGEYKGLNVPRQTVEVTDADIESRLEMEQRKNSRQIEVTDRAVEDGDNIILDFKGMVDGVAFDGGEATDYPLTIGSGSFIPGFEEQLIGMALEETKDVNVTFPENYQAAELAGKDAVFTCTVHKITTEEMPELDDEFADEVSEFDTLDAWKESIREEILKGKKENADRIKESDAIKAAVENAKMDIPEAMIDFETEQQVSNFEMQLAQQGLNMEQYMQFTGMDASKLMEEMRPQALQRIQSNLVLEAIAEKENIEVTDEDLEKEYQTMADMYKMEVDKIKEIMGDEASEQMKADLKVRKAVDILRDSAVEVDMPEEDRIETLAEEAIAEATEGEE